MFEKNAGQVAVVCQHDLDGSDFTDKGRVYHVRIWITKPGASKV